MNPEAVLRKTAKGEEEMQTRAHGLERGLRNVLILIDGGSTVAQIADKAAGMQGFEASLNTLAEQGFVEISGGGQTSGAGPGQAKQALLEIARSLLGAEAAKVIGKLEGAPETREGLLEATAQCKKVVRLLIDEKKADELMARCQTVLNTL